MGIFGEEAKGIANRGVGSNTQFHFNPFPEQDYIEVLLGCIHKALQSRNQEIRKKAFARMNAKLENHGLSVVPPSHEWSDVGSRLLFLRYYVEGVALIADGNVSEDDMIKSIIYLEIEHERKTNSHYAAYQGMTEKFYGRKFRAPDPPPVEKEPELDEDTKRIIEKRKINEKLKLYIDSLSKGAEQSNAALSVLIIAYVDTLSDLSIPLSLDFQDQEERARKHWVLEWMQANDFPYQYKRLFDVLDDLLNMIRRHVREKDLDMALERLAVAQNLYEYLADLLYQYYSAKVKKGSRVVIVLIVLKSISRMILSIVVFRNVKGVVSQFAALIAVNLVYQKLDQTIGVREKGLSGGDAVKDAALELLTVKITAKVSEFLAVRFRIDPKSISMEVMSALTGTVIGAMEEEFVKLARGQNFVGFLQNLRKKFSSPEFWVENVIMIVLNRSYKSNASFSLPIGKNTARVAAVVGVLAFNPKAATASANKPAITDVAPQDAATGSSTARSTAAIAPARSTAPAGAQISVQRASTDTAVSQGVPTRQQRSTDNVTMSPSTNATTNGKSPVTPLGTTLPLIGLAVVVAKSSKRGKILKLFLDANKLLDRINDPDARKRCEERLAKLRKEYDSSNDHAETKKKIQAIRNKINEIFAEEQINFLLEHNLLSFGIRKILGKVAVPRRGTDGPEIIDMVYKVETKDGKIAFLVIESKYGRSTLGWVWYGKIKVRQFSPEWFEMRIDEIRVTEPAFAKELENGWKKGAILPFVMKIRADGSPKAFVDYTAEWTKYMQPTKKKP